VYSFVCGDWQCEEELIRSSQRSNKGIAGSVELCVQPATSSRSDRSSCGDDRPYTRPGACGDVAYTLPSPDNLMIRWIGSLDLIAKLPLQDGEHRAGLQ
jgi:hypothetical protein